MNKQRLFVASAISLLTTSMVFAIRGDIEGALSTAFHLSKEQVGLIWGPAFWGFTIAIFIAGAIVDFVGMKVLHALSAIGFIGGVALVLVAPHPAAHVDSIFGSAGTTMLYLGFLLMGLSQGLVEGVINPLVATIYSDEKTKRLNMLHAFWPFGMIVGGIVALVLTKIDAPWQLKLGTIIIPSLAYLAMAVTGDYPKTERVESNVSTSDMFKAGLHPLFFLIFITMWLTAATELGPDQWFPSIMKELTGLQGIMFLMYTAGLMFVLRFFFGGVAHKLSPFVTLAACCAIAAVGLFWLGSLGPGTPAIVAFAAATVFGVGKTYLWPTMLAVTSERFPRGGALLMNIVGGVGMASIAIVLPVMGAQFDALGPAAALRSVAYLPVGLFFVFGAVAMYFRAKGGYVPLSLDAGEVGMAQGNKAPVFARSAH
jgi:fucose permease